MLDYAPSREDRIDYLEKELNKADDRIAELEVDCKRLWEAAEDIYGELDDHMAQFEGQMKDRHRIFTREVMDKHRPVINELRPKYGPKGDADA